MSAWHEGGETHKFGVPVALDEKIKAFMLSLEASQVGAFVVIMDEFVKTGTVPLSEKPVRRTASESDGNVLTEVETGIKKVMDENEGMSYNDASKMFFRDNEQLYDDYLEASLDEEVDA
jgi:glutathionyl-hydroquinone reductase